MKKVIGGVAALAFLLVLGSCGGASEADVVGKWKVDASSVNIELGDAVPDAIKGEVDEAMKEMKSGKAKDEMDKVTFDFQEGGKLVISADGEEQEAKWSIDGDYLVIEGDMDGRSGKLKLNIDEVSGDKMTVSLTGEEILAQIKEQAPEMIEMMKQMPNGGDVDKMAEGTKFSVSLKK